MKNFTTLGVLIGLALALCIIYGSWMLLVLAVLLGGAGGLIGAHLDGRIDIKEIWYKLIGKAQG